MSWKTIKESIKNDLLSRNLKNPNIRLNALERIEKLFRDLNPNFIKNPEKELLLIDKIELKNRLSKLKKSGKISGSESSIINEIYRRL